MPTWLNKGKINKINTNINWRSSYFKTRSLDWLVLEVPWVSTELGKMCLVFMPLSHGIAFQAILNLVSLVPIGQFRYIFEGDNVNV